MEDLAAIVQHLAPGGRLDAVVALEGGVSARVQAVTLHRVDRVPGATTLPPDPGPAMAEILLAIHAAPLDGLPPLPAREDPLPALREWLPAHAARLAPPPRVPPRLLHGDYWPGNLLWRGAALAAVLDCEDAAVGDPLSDLACARVELACAAGTAAMERFTACYSGGASVDLAALPTWDLYVSTAALAAMRPWGPPPARRAARAFRAAAFAALGLA